MYELHFTSVALAVSDDALDLYRRCLTPQEIARANRFATSQLARRFSVARGALRFVLGQSLDMDPADVKFDIGPFGKPCLATEHTGQRRLHFNLSHSGDEALIGIGEVELGVDIETIDRAAQLDQVAAQVMTDTELNVWNKILPGARRQFFYRVWAAKEACMKQTGEGLCRDPREILVRPSEGTATTVTGESTWHLIELPTEPGYVACSATMKLIASYDLCRFAGP